MDDLLREFLAEADERLDIVEAEWVRFERDPDDQILNSILRLLHGIKGPCGFLGLARLEALAHATETLLSRFRDGLPVTRAAARLTVATLDRLRAILAELERGAAEPDGSDADLIGALDLTSYVALPATPLPEPDAFEGTPCFPSVAGARTSSRGGMRPLMQPIESAWRRLPRVVDDLSGTLDKRLALVMRGAETELDRGVLEIIKDPLIHMVRNAADHGIESARERKAVGKPERGTIRLDARQESGTITIEIADDGKGLDFSAIRREAVARRVASEAAIGRMSDDEAAALIFRPGFSTAKVVTAVSGRGVGLDVVKTGIARIGGSIAVRSEPGRGTTFTITLPLTRRRPGRSVRAAVAA